MEGRPDIGLDSYDRLFPNQDTLPHGGFGNLIALPLQKQATRARATASSSTTISCHGAINGRFLSSVRQDQPSAGRSARAGRRAARPHPRRAAAAADEDDDEPWTAPPSRRRTEPPIAGELPQTLELVLGNQIYIAKDGCLRVFETGCFASRRFRIPEFYKAQAMRLSTYDKPRVIACAEDHPHHIGLPRGCLDDVRQSC